MVARATITDLYAAAVPAETRPLLLGQKAAHVAGRPLAAVTVGRAVEFVHAEERLDALKATGNAAPHRT